MTNTARVRDHYDKLSNLYSRYWGDHIHHGYWTGDTTPPGIAQERLIIELASRAEIQSGNSVVDLGCGIGGSSRWLARRLGCSVLGITISPVQAKLATDRTRKEGLADRVRFVVADMSSVTLDSLFDVAWVIESSEHVQDKAAFIRSVAWLLKPNGAFAICAWLAPDHVDDSGMLNEVCRGMLCPNLGSMSDYRRWLNEAGLTIESAEDITENVRPTWTYCSEIAKRRSVRAILRCADSSTRRFVETFPIMATAYQTGALRYGMIVARKSFS